MYEYGVAKCVSTYNSHGKPIEQKYLNVDYCLTVHRKIGAAKMLTKVDAKGNRGEATFFDANNNPCNNSLGFFKVTAKYNYRNTPIEYIYYNMFNTVIKHSVLVTCVANVLPMSNGALKGIKPGDIIISYAGKNCFSHSISLDEMIQFGRYKTKAVIWARPVGIGIFRSFKIFEATFPSGVIGLELKNSYCENIDYQKILYAMKNHKGDLR